MKNNELRKNIEDWLKTQGYSLEMTVAKILQDARFAVNIGEVYTDPETDKSREIDVTASDWIVGDFCTIQVSFQIECKISKSHPWVVFMSESNPGYYMPHRLICSDLYLFFLRKILHEGDWKTSLRESGLFGNKRLGHGIARAFTDGPDVPYKAILSAVKSSLSLVAEIDNYDKGRMQGYQLGIAIPVVVFDGKLFEAILDADGEVSITEVEQSKVNWKRNRNNTIVSVVTRSGFENFTTQMQILKDTLSQLTYANFEKLEQMCENVMGVDL